MAIRDLFSRKQVCHFLVTDEGEIAKKYNHFMEFLTNNRAALGIISELEQLYYGSGPFTMAGVETQYGKLAAANLTRTANRPKKSEFDMSPGLAVTSSPGYLRQNTRAYRGNEPQHEQQYGTQIGRRLESRIPICSGPKRAD